MTNKVSLQIDRMNSIERLVIISLSVKIYPKFLFKIDNSRIPFECLFFTFIPGFS